MKINLTVVFTKTARAEVGIGGFTYLDIHIYVEPTAPLHLCQVILYYSFNIKWDLVFNPVFFCFLYFIVLHQKFPSGSWYTVHS